MHTDVREYINLCRVKRDNMTEAELARRTGQSPQNMNNKYKRNTFKIAELQKVAGFECGSENIIHRSGFGNLS